jgi:predicted Zn-dependent protease
MLDRRTRELLRKVRDEAAGKGLSASFTLHRENSHLMRIGNSSVSLNTSEQLTRLDLRVVDGRREGTHTHLVEIRDADTVREALNVAVTKAAMAAEKSYQPLLEAVEDDMDESPQFDPALAGLDPVEKAKAYSEIIRRAGEEYNYSGSCSSGVTEIYMVTTANEREVYHQGTDQLFSVVLKDPEDKWELRHDQTGWRFDQFSVDSTVSHLNSLLPIYRDNPGFRVDEGEYTVVLGSEALSGILSFAVFTGMNGRMWEENQGWTSDRKPGDKIVGENLTVVDDPSNENTFRFGFDLTGKARKRFPLIERGVLRNLMYDISSAARFGKDPTGHDTRSLSMVVETGDGPADPLQAVADDSRVLWIPALHYMNMPSMSRGIFTGSSRFNAVLVENGKIVSPIFSTRITDSFQNVLNNVRTLSSVEVSENGSSTYARRAPVAMALPSYAVVEKVKVTDCAESF